MVHDSCKMILRGFLWKKYDKDNKPNDANNRYPYAEIIFPCLMIEGFLHAKPDTKSSAKECESPERLLTHSPPVIDRFHFIDPHDDIGEKIDDYYICQHVRLLE